MRNVNIFGDRLSIEVTFEQAKYRVMVRPLYNTRIFVIEESPQLPLLVGQLTMPRWPTNVEARAHVNRQCLSFRADGVIFRVYEDLYAVHRALSYTLQRYTTNEVPRLTTALQYCQTLHGVILGLRKDNFQELIYRIESLVDQVIDVIGLRVQNEEKVAALKRVITTRTGVDSLNRVNSGALCLKMLTSVGELIRREAQVVDISEIFASRRQAVRLGLATLETQVLIVEDFLNQILANWNIVCLQRRELTIAQLEQFMPTLAIPVKPFSTTFRHVIREFGEAGQHIRKGRLDKAKTLLTTAAASMRLRRLRVQLETVHYRIACAVHDPSLRKNAGRIAQEVMPELLSATQELQAIDTLGMVDFSSTLTLAVLADVQAALANGNCVAAADNFRITLRAI